MLQRVRRGVVAVVCALLLAVLAVACTGTAQVTPFGSGMQASVGGMRVQLPPAPFQEVPPSTISPTSAQTTTQRQAPLRDALHGVDESGIGCPLSLPHY